MIKSLNAIGSKLTHGLLWSRSLRQEDAAAAVTQETVNVMDAGSVISAAYEQLRNATDNNEEHLLLQSAIRRFFKKAFLLADRKLLDESGDELVIELTLAGYIPNNSVTTKQTQCITRLAHECYDAYQWLRKLHVPGDIKALGWALDVASAESAALLQPQYEDRIMGDVAYEHYMATLPAKTQQASPQSSAAMFVAVQQALLRNNTAVIRANVLARYGVRAADKQAFLERNQQLDALLDAPALDAAYHTVNRHGAAPRILRRMMLSRDDMPELLLSRAAFLEAYTNYVGQEYDRIMTRVNRAVGRSVVFLIITKMLVGLAVELPYDLIVHNAILWQPLLINLLFPPLWILALRMTLSAPGPANTAALVGYSDAMLYGNHVHAAASAGAKRRQYGGVFSAAYIIIGLAVLAGVVYALNLLQFTLVHSAIFIMFFSTASFLGFRLSRMVREVEMVRTNTNGITIIRDIIYLPFVVIGQWMSDKYSRVNIVGLMLDVLIDMPLKTILRLLRQWAAFIDDRKDHLS